MTEEELDTQVRDQAFISMRKSLDSAGITSGHLIKKLKEELDAEGTKVFSHQGVKGDVVNVVAWDIRQRARQDAHKLPGDYPVEDRFPRKDIITVNIIIPEHKKKSNVETNIWRNGSGLYSKVYFTSLAGP